MNAGGPIRTSIVSRLAASGYRGRHRRLDVGALRRALTRSPLTNDEAAVILAFYGDGAEIVRELTRPRVMLRSRLSSSLVDTACATLTRRGLLGRVDATFAPSPAYRQGRGRLMAYLRELYAL